MSFATRFKLSFMMFLEFFIWGAWFVTLGTFVKNNLLASDSDVGLAFLSQSIGAIIAPFIIGMIADKYFAAQRILGLLHLIGAGLLYYASTLTSFDDFLPIVMAYMVCFMPTLALANSVSFRQLTDTERQFPGIRVFGTIGWIIAGLVIGWLSWEKTNSLQLTFILAAAASGILAIFSLFLPDTPPTKKNEKTTIGEILGLEAFALLKNKSFLLFFLSSIAICVPLTFYYNFTNIYLNEIGMQSAAAIQSLGQVSETLFLLVMPFLFVRLGVKKMLGIGMLAWVLRYAFFAFGDAGQGYWMLVMGIVLHGICYDFFFVTGQIYTDKLAGPKIKSAAQGFISLATYGVGMLIGSLLSGKIVESYVTADGGHNWETIWLIPAGIAFAVLVIFLLMFKDTTTRNVANAE
ncbi:nucleoside permease [Sphingobacterium chungjuense]|uniref:nucleoside permease n=1 Tax=Sphingobacterium chungjuense TaxID=2675553 RepID=UPI00140CF03B|nr:nucleoside permease [Sphingobacterium chungjuense]